MRCCGRGGRCGRARPRRAWTPEASGWRHAGISRRRTGCYAGAVATARCECTAELLCAELSADGLPMDRAAAERLLTGLIGPRPGSEAEAAALRAARDEQVLRHAPPGVTADLRSPVQVRSLL